MEHRKIHPHVARLSSWDPAASYCLRCHANLKDAVDHCLSCGHGYDSRDPQGALTPETLITLQAWDLGLLFSLGFGATVFLLVCQDWSNVRGASILAVLLTAGAVLGYFTRTINWLIGLLAGLGTLLGAGVLACGFFFGLIIIFGVIALAVLAGPFLLGVLAGRITNRLIVTSNWARSRYLEPPEDSRGERDAEAVTPSVHPGRRSGVRACRSPQV